MGRIKVYATNFGVDEPNPYYDMFANSLCTYNKAFTVVRNIDQADILLLFTPTEFAYTPDIALMKSAGDKKVVLINASEGWSFYGKTREFGYKVLQPENVILAFNTHHQKGNVHHTKEGIKKYDFIFPIYPLDPVWNSIQTNHIPQDKITFLNRANNLEIICSCFSISRKRMLDVVKNWKGRTFVHDSMHSPRLPINEVYKKQEESKICISVEGGSYKMVRHQEIVLNSVVAIHPYDYEYSFPWIDGFNCIVLPYDGNTEPFDKIDIERGGWYRYLGGPEVQECKTKLQYYINNGDELYTMYLNSLKTAENYKPSNYYGNYIGNKILETYRCSLG